MTRVLVTGATGFVGARLSPVLLEAGHSVRAMTRDPDAYEGPGEPVRGDVHDPSTLPAALDGVDVAIYLVHSLGVDDFERKDAEAAHAFGEAAADAGVRQIVYLGGLGSQDDDLSAHLRSRREVEGLLGSGGVPVTVLRAAVIVGHGGISWELTRQIVQRLPAMVVPRWAATPTQPIWIDDAIAYLAGVVDRSDAFDQVYEIGGADQLTYVEMMQQAAEQIRGGRIPLAVVPVLTPRLSSHWISLITDVDTTTAKNLIDSMSIEVVVTDHSIHDVVQREPVTYAEAVRSALVEASAQTEQRR